jgi:thioredoxin reductase (NADPH)
VVTPEEVGGVAVFAGLDPTVQSRLARAAADISLPAGEYAAHEGDGGALFAVLEGKIEPVKAVDGVERVVGERQPGEIFGEVPSTCSRPASRASWPAATCVADR